MSVGFKLFCCKSFKAIPLGDNFMSNATASILETALWTGVGISLDIGGAEGIRTLGLLLDKETR